MSNKDQNNLTQIYFMDIAVQHLKSYAYNEQNCCNAFHIKCKLN